MQQRSGYTLPYLSPAAFLSAVQKNEGEACAFWYYRIQIFTPNEDEQWRLSHSLPLLTSYLCPFFLLYTDARMWYVQYIMTVFKYLHPMRTYSGEEATHYIYLLLTRGFSPCYIQTRRFDICILLWPCLNIDSRRRYTVRTLPILELSPAAFLPVVHRSEGGICSYFIHASNLCVAAVISLLAWFPLTAGARFPTKGSSACKKLLSYVDVN